MFMQTEELVLKQHLALNCQKNVLSSNNTEMNKYITLTLLRGTLFSPCFFPDSLLFVGNLLEKKALVQSCF